MFSLPKDALTASMLTERDFLAQYKSYFDFELLVPY